MTIDEKQPNESTASTTDPRETDERIPHRRGFAAMDAHRIRAIARKGGRAAHATGQAHQFTSEEARIAGKKGGMAPHVRRGGLRQRPVPPSPPSSRADAGRKEN